MTPTSIAAAAPVFENDDGLIVPLDAALIRDAALDQHDTTTIPIEHPWDRQPDERDSAYRAFLIYRDSRTWNEATGRALACGLRDASHLRGYAHQHNWAARATAWDDHQRRQHDHKRLLLEHTILDAAQAAANTAKIAIGAAALSYLDYTDTNQSRRLAPIDAARAAAAATTLLNNVARPATGGNPTDLSGMQHGATGGVIVQQRLTVDPAAAALLLDAFTRVQDDEHPNMLPIDTSSTESDPDE
jgi:hypothetical protein